MATTEFIETSSEPSQLMAAIKRKVDLSLDKTMVSRAMDTFDPAKHIDFKYPSKTYSMNDIRLENSPISGFAVSEPFQLFTPEAVKRMRAEIFKPVVMNNFQYSSNLAQCQLRGYAATYEQSNLLSALDK